MPKSSQRVFSKAGKRIVGRVKRSESPSVQVPQSSEEDLVVWKRNPRGMRGHQSVSLAPTTGLLPRSEADLLVATGLLPI